MNFKKTVICSAPVTAEASAASGGLPTIKILATGGTIAGTAAENTTLTGYKAGDLTIQTLINAVPAIKEVAEVSGEQLANIDSKDLTDDILLKLAKRCNELCQDPAVDGIVITHGTDTLEETAYFLNLTVKSNKPVVIVGAMRPATAISADGPLNLLNAVKVAASKAAVGKGVLVVMNDTINSGRDVAKTNTTNVATFANFELGALGLVAGGKPEFFRESTKLHTMRTEFDASQLNSLPRVDIIYSHANDDRIMVDAAVAAGAKGIIHAGTGNGSIHKNCEPGLADAAKKGVVVVRSSRVGNGVTTKGVQTWTDLGYVESNTLNPQKARILLQLALTKTADPKAIQEMFNKY